MKRLIKKLASIYGYTLINTGIKEASDDPYKIVKKLFSNNIVSTIVDGGASIGETSIKLSQIFPDANIHSFEPFPTFFEILKKRTKSHLKITESPLALSDSEGKEILDMLDRNLSY